MNRTRKAGPFWPSKSNSWCHRFKRDKEYRRNRNRVAPIPLYEASIPLAEKNQ